MTQINRNAIVLCWMTVVILACGLSASAQSDPTRRLYNACCGFDLNEAAALDALKAGGDINWKNDAMGDETMLIMSVKGFKESKIIKFLVEHGADVSIKDRTGKTALEWAHQYNIGKDRNGREILALLEAASGKAGNPTGELATQKGEPTRPAETQGNGSTLPPGSTTMAGAPSVAEIKKMIEEKMTTNYEHHFGGTEVNQVSFSWMGPINVVGTDVRGRIPHKCWNVKLDVKITFEKPSSGETSWTRRGIQGNLFKEIFCIWRDDSRHLDFVTYQP